jgi:hypothetical protein
MHHLRLSCCCLQGALLLLLFRGSHQLEHRLTEKAAGGLQRLFDSVPDRAVVVEVEEGSNAPRVATSQEVCTAAAAGAHTVQSSVLAPAGWFFLCNTALTSREWSGRSRQMLPYAAGPATAAYMFVCPSPSSLSKLTVCCPSVLLQVAASDVSIGQHVLVRPGEQVPLDGIITWGTANLSLQHISGEAQPVKLGPGQEVPAGGFGF